MKKLVITTFSLFALAIGGCTTMCIIGGGNQKADKPVQKQVEVKNVEVKQVPEVVKTYDKNVIDFIPTERGQGYDKNY